MHRQKLPARLGNRARAMPRAQFPLLATPAMHLRAKMPALIRACRQRNRQLLKGQWSVARKNVAIASPDRLSVSLYLYVAVQCRQLQKTDRWPDSVIRQTRRPLSHDRQARLSLLIIPHVGIFRFVAELGRKF